MGRRPKYCVSGAVAARHPQHACTLARRRQERGARGVCEQSGCGLGRFSRSAQARNANAQAPNSARLMCELRWRQAPRSALRLRASRWQGAPQAHRLLCPYLVLRGSRRSFVESCMRADRCALGAQATAVLRRSPRHHVSAAWPPGSAGVVRLLFQEAAPASRIVSSSRGVEPSPSLGQLHRWRFGVHLCSQTLHRLYNLRRAHIRSVGRDFDRVRLSCRLLRPLCQPMS